MLDRLALRGSACTCSLSFHTLTRSITLSASPPPRIPYGQLGGGQRKIQLPAQMISSPLFGNEQIIGANQSQKPHTMDVIKVDESGARGKLADRPMARAAGTMAPCLSTTSGAYLLLLCMVGAGEVHRRLSHPRHSVKRSDAAVAPSIPIHPRSSIGGPSWTT